jgi:hypothetical protein
VAHWISQQEKLLTVPLVYVLPVNDPVELFHSRTGLDADAVYEPDRPS